MSRRQEAIAVLSLLVGICGCVGGYLALPQVQRVLDALTTAQQPAYPTRTPTPIPTSRSTARPSALDVTAPTVLVSGLFSSLWQKHSANLGNPLSGNGTDRPVSGAEMLFEGGHTFSLSSPSKRIWVLIGSKRGAWTGTGSWREYADTWQNGEPDFSCPKEADYPKQPIRGFGRVWCNNPEVRNALGWGLGREWWPEDEAPGKGVQRIQEFEHGFIFRDSDGWTNGLAYVLLQSGTFVRQSY